MHSNVVIYTDGSFRPNTRAGGWAIHIEDENNKHLIYGAETDRCSAPRMELLAAVNALKALKNRAHVWLYSDCQYVVSTINGWIRGWAAKGWKGASGQPLKNVDLLKELLEELERHNVTSFWVKGHADDPLNNLVDEYAQKASEDPEAHSEPIIVKL